MKKSVSIGLFMGAVFVLLVGLFVVNAFIYPFSSASPNYADVDNVFNKLQVPSDWQEISHSEVKGIAGRQCPIESDGCFSRGKRFKVSGTLSEEKIREFVATSGCVNPTYSVTEVLGGENTASYACSVDGVQVSGSLLMYRSGWEASIYARSR